MSNSLARIAQPWPDQVIDAKHEPARRFGVHLDFPDIASGDEFRSRYRYASIDDAGMVHMSGAAFSADEHALIHDMAQRVNQYLRKNRRGAR